MENNSNSNDYSQNGGNRGEQHQRRPRINRSSGDDYRANSNGYQRRSSNVYSSSREDYRGNDFKRNSYNREGGYQNREGRYQNRENRQFKREGGYQNRENRQFNRENGYYQNRENRQFNREGGYNNRESGYQNRENRPYNREGGYQKREGGYQNRENRQFKNRQFNNGEQKSYNPNAKYSQKKQIEYKKQYVDYSQPMRLNKFIANSGICSRREADDYITAGVVTVNGEVISELGYKIIPATDKVMFHDQPVKVERKVYILLNKPKDCVTTVEDTHDRKTVLDIVQNACSERVYPVGRLDRNTTGVLLITNDGDLTSKLTHPKYDKKKIYQVTLDHDLEEKDFEKIQEGITLEDGEIKVDEIAFVKEEDRKTVGVEIHSGRNRIVRRIFDSLGYRVVRLDRVYFAGLTKKNLPRGKWRYLSEMEVNMLKMSAASMKD